MHEMQVTLGRNSTHGDYCQDPNFPARQVVRVDSAVAAVSLGQIVDGHLVVAPNEHVLSLRAHMASGLARHVSEYTHCVARAVSAVQHIYGCGVARFEHGPSRPGSSAGCGTDHAHLHLIPTDEDIYSAVLAPGLNWRPCTGLTAITEMVSCGQEYLFLEERSGCWLTHVGEPLPRQFLRHRIAAALGRPARADWRSCAWGREDEQTVDRFRHYFAAHPDQEGSVTRSA